MWKQDLKKIAMLTVGVGGALALYNSRYSKNRFILILVCTQTNIS